MIRNVSSQMQQYQSDKEVKYQNVYICTPGILWHLNLLIEDVNEYDISKVQFDGAVAAVMAFDRAIRNEGNNGGSV